MRLFICEKPSQGRDIAKHVGAKTAGKGCLLGQDVAVTWCIGHLLEQAEPEAYLPETASKYWDLAVLPIIPPQWKMVVKSSVKEQFGSVKELLGKASEVVIATDADREGEVIAREVMQVCGYKGPVQRLWLGALDDASVKKALAKLLPGAKTLPMYYSGMGRSRADWLAGMNLTRALTKAFGAGGKDGVLSCGRVQTPTLGLIVRRERQILNFKPKTYYVLDAVFEMMNAVVPMGWQAPQAMLDKDGHLVQKAAVEQVANKVRNQAGRLVKVDIKPERELAPLLYSLGSLQQEASRRYGIKAQAVLDAAQALYEKHKATTYPRTDCEYLPESQKAEAPMVLEALGKTEPSMYPLVQLSIKNQSAKVRCFNDKQITAHHAIIPTTNPAVRVGEMSSIERKVYDLICRRYLAQFLGDYEYSKTVIEVECVDELFAATGKTPLKLGWKQAYQGLEQGDSKPKGRPSADDAEESGEDAHKNASIPSVKVGDQAINRKANVNAKQTKPPKRYTEGTLLAAMENIAKEIEDPRLKKIMQSKEKAGIGTDATRAEVIETLFRRDFIELDKKNLLPKPKGMQLIELIERIEPSLADPVLTAEWEDMLGQVEAGAIQLAEFEADIAQWLRTLIDSIKAKAESESRIAVKSARNPTGQGVDMAPKPTAYKCPKCASSLSQIGRKLECKAGGCGFGMWASASGKDIPAQDIEALLAGRETNLIEGMKSKEGKLFAARLKLDENDWKVKYAFENTRAQMPAQNSAGPAKSPVMLTGKETYLKVSFDDKDKVKALGARWSSERKAWYVPTGVDSKPFEQWM